MNVRTHITIITVDYARQPQRLELVSRIYTRTYVRTYVHVAIDRCALLEGSPAHLAGKWFLTRRVGQEHSAKLKGTQD